MKVRDNISKNSCTIKLLLGAAALLYSCGALSKRLISGLVPEEIYVAQLSSLNSEISGLTPHGTVTVLVSRRRLHVWVKAEGLTPVLRHRLYFYGIIGQKESSCPVTPPDNADGITDSADVSLAAGDRLIPLNAYPQHIDLSGAGYPVSESDGNLYYTKSIPFAALSRSFRKEFGTDTIPFEDMALIIHGAAPGIELPDSPRTIHGLSAQESLPVLCGKLIRQSGGC